jgi:hypothetical protein
MKKEQLAFRRLIVEVFTTSELPINIAQQAMTLYVQPFGLPAQSQPEKWTQAISRSLQPQGLTQL